MAGGVDGDAAPVVAHGLVRLARGLLAEPAAKVTCATNATESVSNRELTTSAFYIVPVRTESWILISVAIFEPVAHQIER